MTQASRNSETKPGDILAGRYEIAQLLGEGGMGVVFEARHVRLGTRVAIKLLRDDAAKNPEIVRRFDREARAAAQLTSPHVARVIDVDTIDGKPFMVMEHLEGIDLDQLLGEQHSVPPVDAVDYVLQACSAMAEAHAHGIVHRDLKPDNLFLDRSSGTPTIKVLDFGISKIPLEEGLNNHTQTTAAFGTPTYMSPDQIQSAKNVDARADIWSLGVILYELICGKPPFGGESATAIIWSICADEPKPLFETGPGIPPGLSEVVMKALEKDRDYRYATVAEFAAALAPHGSAGTWSPPDASRTPPERSSNRGVVFAEPDAASPPLVSLAAQTAIEAQSGRPKRDTGRAWTTPRSQLRKRGRVVTLAVLSSLIVVAAAIGVAILSTPRAPIAGAPAETPAAPSHSDEADDVDIDEEPSNDALVPAETTPAPSASSHPSKGARAPKVVAPPPISTIPDIPPPPPKPMRNPPLL